MKLHTVNTGYFKLDGGAMFGVVPKSIWNKLNPADENNMCPWALRCLLIEHENKIILIDNGNGDKQDAKFFSHYYLFGDDTLNKSLNQLGFSVDDVTDAYLTHLHFDHCGGSIVRSGEKLVPAFKNATYWSTQAHWQTATQPNAREKASFLKENILPIQESGQLKFIEQPARDPAPSSLPKGSGIIDAMKTIFVHGHTDSMMLPVVSYKNKTIVFVADLFPSHNHIPIPYVMAYDMFPLTTMNEKKLFLEEAVENDYILFFEHDPVYECCTLEQTAKGVRPKEFFKLSEI